MRPDNIDHCKIDGFQAIHLLRPCSENFDYKSRGGGISFFIRDTLSFIERKDLVIMEPYLKCSFIALNFNKAKYLIGGFYRPPSSDINVFTEHFNRLIEPINPSYKLILLGDYNVDLLNNNSSKNTFNLCMQLNYLFPTILAPTRVALSFNQAGNELRSETLLDNIFINYQTNFTSGIIESSITDHYPIFIILPDIDTKLDQSTTIKFRMIDERSYRTFNSYLLLNRINDILDDYCAESAFSKFYDIFVKCYDKSFPIK